MELGDARELAENLMVWHNLNGWTFTFDRAKKRCGYCNYRIQRLSLSRYYVEYNGWNEIRDTILHEIAHALAGHAAGHGPAWKLVARRIGARPERCAAGVSMPEGKYRGLCACNGATPHTRHRLPRTHLVYQCNQCQSDITWVVRR